jgi:hypothetical protein
MQTREQAILLKAGYHLFRCDLVGKRIWTAKSVGGWALHAKHEKQIETKRAWNEIMKDQKNLAG